MYTTLFSLHPVDQEKLQDVVAAMQALGAPIIRIVDCADHYVALEGTHRLAACAELGIPPQFVVLEQEDLVEADSLDWQNLGAGESYTAGELAAEAYHRLNGIYTIDEDGRIHP